MSTKYSFIEKRGSVEVLAALRKGAKSFSELKNLNMSPNTVLARLREAQNLGLTKVVPVSSDRRTRIKYGLSEEGKALVLKFDSAVTEYIKLQEQLKELSQKKREMFDRIAEELTHSRS